MEHGYLPLSNAQYNIYSQEMAAPGTDVNNLYFVLEIARGIDEERMVQAIDRFLRENDGPRTRIAVRDGEPVQHIAPHKPARVPCEDLSGLSRADQVRRYQALGQSPFPFQNGRLVEFRVLRLAPDRSGVFCKFHHIWCDGWATGLIWSDILRGYLALENGGELPAKRTSFAQFLPENAAYQSSEQREADRAFWEGYLDGVEQAELHLSHTQLQDRGADRSVFRMQPALSGQVRRFAEQTGVPPYAVFTAAMQVYQARCRFSGDVVLGMPRLNRDTGGHRDAVGMYVVDLPMRLRAGEDTPFAELCRMVKREGDVLTQHKKYPLTAMVEDLSRKRELGKSLIDCSVSYQKTRIDTGEWTLPVEVWFGNPAHMIGELTWHVLDLFAGDAYTVFFDYRTVLYTEEQIAALYRSLCVILDEGTRNPQKQLAEFSVVVPEDCARLMKLGAAPPSAGETTALSLWKEAVERYPDRDAVVGERAKIRYTELDGLSDRIAGALGAHGAQHGGITAILLPRDHRVLASAIGVWKAGQGFLWIDPDYPEDRLRVILEDSGAHCAVTTAELAGRLVDLPVEVLLYENLPEAPPPRVEVRPDDLCYSIYTSGTTGRPKGVLVEHRGLANLARPDSCGLVGAVAEAGRAVLAIGSFAFDISVLEIFTSLLNGVAVAFAGQDDLESPLRLAGRMRECGVNTLFATPSRLLAYLEHKEFCRVLQKVDVLMSGGESFPAGLYERLREISPTMRVFNAYGPTEASIVTTVHEADGPTPPLGQPVRGYTLRVLGRDLQMLPAGAAGELCVGGIGLARGYRNLPEETAEKFVEQNGQRLYRTGDLVRWGPRGELLYLGRIDNQVKLRGLRIELAEIESVFAAVPAVSACVVVVKKSAGNEYLCGFYTAEKEIAREVLLEALGGRLPYYMVPSVFVRLARIPTTINGKADRGALEELAVERGDEYAPPQTREEALLCRILQKLLGVERVGAEDNFFEIGGNSLLAARFVVEAKAHGIELEYGDLFRMPTVRQLCRAQTGEGEQPELLREIQDFDYAKLEPLLRWREPAETAPQPRDILLTGATGFLGLHVLRELIDAGGRIHCLVRPGEKLAAEDRLRNLLFYYFEDDFSELFGERLFALEGDITLPGIADGMPERLDLVVNCAADVSHYSYGDRMYRINVQGVRALIDLCRSRNCRLVHISTPTIGQFGIVGQTAEKAVLTEEDFFFGQDLTNQYAATKFLAERAVLEAVREGLDALVLRVGNLQARFSDGEFQINHASNAFTSRIRTYVQLGFAPEEVWAESVDYSPVDETARAICALLRLRGGSPVCHIFNGAKTPYARILEVLDRLERPVRPLSRAEYRGRVEKILAQPERRELLRDLIAQAPGEMEGHFEIGYTCEKTCALLAKQGFVWPEITGEYLETCLQNLDTLGAFDEL